MLTEATQREANTAVGGQVDPLVRMRLVHYGADKYRDDMIEPISDVPFRNKPQGGLWTSPVGSEYGWKNWCEAEDYGDLSNSFELEFEGTVLKIDSVEDMEQLPWIEVDGVWFVSFQALCPSPIGFYYDAIHLTVKGQRDTRFTHPKSLYGWDCETVLILNPATVRAT